MHADICDPRNDADLARFHIALKRLGAANVEWNEALGVNVYKLRIGAEEITVFSDQWSVDIEGPSKLVQQVLDEYHRDQNTG